MEIIAKTDSGYLVSATESEVRAITKAVQGNCPEKIVNGHKMPAFDYAALITKARSLNENHNYQYMLERWGKFQDELDELKQAIDYMSDI